MARCLNEGRPGVSDGVVGQRAGTAGLSSFEKARRSDEAAPAGRTRLRSDDLHPRRFSSSGSPSIERAGCVFRSPTDNDPEAPDKRRRKACAPDHFSDEVRRKLLSALSLKFNLSVRIRLSRAALWTVDKLSFVVASGDAIKYAPEIKRNPNRGWLGD